MVTLEPEVVKYLNRKGVKAITIEAPNSVHSCCGEFCFEPGIRLGAPIGRQEDYLCFVSNNIEIYYHQELPRKPVIIERQSWGLFSTLHIKNWRIL